MEEILSYFIMPAFTATMDAINLPQTPRPDTVPESSKFILEELERRFKAGQSIEKDCAAIKKIEEKFESGEYDEDPDGFERIVRVSTSFLDGYPAVSTDDTSIAPH